MDGSSGAISRRCGSVFNCNGRRGNRDPTYAVHSNRMLTMYLPGLTEQCVMSIREPYILLILS